MAVILIYPLHDCTLTLYEMSTVSYFFVLLSHPKSWGEIYEECIYNYYFEIK